MQELEKNAQRAGHVIGQDGCCFGKAGVASSILLSYCLSAQGIMSPLLESILSPLLESILNPLLESILNLIYTRSLDSLTLTGCDWPRASSALQK